MTNRISIRLATNADGPEIGNLVWRGGFRVDGIDWSEVEPYWLVAEVSRQPSAVSRQEIKNGAKIVGCLQVLPGKPIGRLEFLVVDEALGHRERATIARDLGIQGYATLKLAGAQAASNLVDFKNKSLKRILKKRGARVMGSGNMFLKRLV